MVELKNGLRWYFNKMTNEGIQDFNRKMASIDMIVSRIGREGELNSLINVTSTISQFDLIISPDKGKISYYIEGGINQEMSSVYSPARTDILNGRDALKLSDNQYRIWFLTSPL